jgi:hypothetical protein
MLPVTMAGAVSTWPLCTVRSTDGEDVGQGQNWRWRVWRRWTRSDNVKKRPNKPLNAYVTLATH